MYDYSDGAPTNQYPKDKVPDTMGYIPIAVTDDGDVLCEKCVLDPTNPVHDASPEIPTSVIYLDMGQDGWGVVGWDHSGNAEEEVTCSHCNKVIVEGNDA